MEKNLGIEYFHEMLPNQIGSYFKWILLNRFMKKNDNLLNEPGSTVTYKKKDATSKNQPLSYKTTH